MTASRFIVGIDLGTTNSALTYVDTSVGDLAECRREPFLIAQVVQPGAVEARPLLPSFLYLPTPNELPAGSLKLPWDAERDYVVGELARVQGAQVPTKLVSSAKSWLCHHGIDRRADVLPWKAPEGVRRISPLEAVTRYLGHLAEAWNQAHPKDLLGQQEIVLTVPASFDAAGRELTAEAARAAGLRHLTLLEEPLAAFYAWLDVCNATWRDLVRVGEFILVVDIGGGTTDFTLIRVDDEAGQLALTRVAVGDHILLGGDNMDLALAHAAAGEFAKSGTKLTSAQILLLSHSCRAAKERLLSDESLSSSLVTVLGRGSRVIGGTIKGELSREQLSRVILDGFFPICPLAEMAARGSTVGLQEIGLPYASEAAITKHLANFLSRQSASIEGGVIPAAVLFNGGVLKPSAIRQRILDVLNNWAKSAGCPPVRVLEGTDLDLAVARGAAYYGLVRRGKGVRIRGGTARAYYIGVESAMPAVPGASPPLKAVCVAPFGMEEGTGTDVPGQEFGLVVGEPAEFRFLGSSTRRDDKPGTLVEDWEDQIEELAPLRVTLDNTGTTERFVPVRLETRVSEVGVLEVWCVQRNGNQRWKLEFSTRQN